MTESIKTFKIDPLLRKLPLSSEALEKLVYTYEVSRAAVFTGQFFSLPIMELLLRGKTGRRPENFQRNAKVAFSELNELLKRDAHNIQTGIYPVDVLRSENPLRFWGRYPKILWDGIRVATRRDERKNADFSKSEEQFFNEVPEYYRRNFHYQTGGYLSEKSADLYEHQVEILFSGAADPMRRLMLPPMKTHFKNSDGEGLHFLELAAGTGRLTRFVKLAFPKARITVLDLSEPYLRRARQSLAEFKGIQYLQGDAANLPFKEAQFDAVYSCFLFHELPESERTKVFSEAQRVLKSGGLYGLVDALQLDDAPEMNWALENFPKDFHEPFFTNYSKNPLDGLFTAVGFSAPQTQRGFFSKVMTATRP